MDRRPADWKVGDPAGWKACATGTHRLSSLFLRGTLRSALPARTATLPAGAATRTTGTSLATRSAAKAALSAGSAGSALTLRRPHLLQLLHLFGCQDLLELRLQFRFECRQFLLLFGGQVQLLHGPRRQQVKPTLSAGSALSGTAGTTGAAFAGRRTLSVGGLIAILSGEQAGRGTECQREEDYFRFRIHAVFSLYCDFPALAGCIASMQ